MGCGLGLLATRRVAFCNVHKEKIEQWKTQDVRFRPRTEQLASAVSGKEYDVVIIGGGATGAGTLISCARKGLRALMIESHDFGSSTSSKSTKLLHGGLRYLERVFKLFSKNRAEDLHLVIEALQERNLLLNNVPYATDIVGMIVPCTNIFVAVYYYIGTMLYHYIRRLKKIEAIDNLGMSVPAPRLVFKTEVREMFPEMMRKYKYGVLTWDGQFDDTGLLNECVLTATCERKEPIEHMVMCDALNYAKLSSFVKDENGRIKGVVVEDKINQKKFEVKCKGVINATGIFADSVRHMANQELISLVTFAKGDHIAVAGNFLKSGSPVGICVPKTKDGRVMFILPWKNGVIAGTTDVAVPEPQFNALPDNNSVSQIVEATQQYFPNTTFEIKSRWAGIRPLIRDTKVAESKDALRVHLIETDDKSGLVSALGGKWTIFRLMGEDAVNALLLFWQKNGMMSEEDVKKRLALSTTNLRLIGDFRPPVYDPTVKQATFTKTQYMNKAADMLFKEYPQVDIYTIKYLIENYGAQSTHILERIKKNPAEATYLSQNHPFTKAEISYIAQNTLVELPIDIVTRRLRISFLSQKEAEELLPLVVDIFGDVRGWSDEKKKSEFELNQNILKGLAFS